MKDKLLAENTDLQLLDSIWQANPSYTELQKSLKNSNDKARFPVHGVVADALPSFLVQLALDHAPHALIYITTESTQHKLQRLQQQIANLLGDLPDYQVLLAPFRRVSPIEELQESSTHYAAQSQLLSQLIRSNQKLILLCPAAALASPLPTPADFAGHSFGLQIGQEIDTTELASRLIAAGYQRQSTVFEVGSFAIRGEVIDLYTPTTSSSWPYRLQLFGDEIENIRRFDPSSQRSIATNEKIEQVNVAPIYTEPPNELSHLLAYFPDTALTVIDERVAICKQLTQMQADWQTQLDKRATREDLGTEKIEQLRKMITNIPGDL